MLLQMKDVCKEFPGVKALDNVQLELRAGEVHALLGENGAGKSTLIKVLGGIYAMDQGQILIDGKEVQIHSVEDARKNGISIIHQELMMVPHLSIAENIFLGQENAKNGIINLKKQELRAQNLLDNFGLDVDAGTLLGELTIAQQQMVEIVRAVSFGAKIIVMDEPTSSLSNKEVDILFETVENLKKKNIGIIYISHRMSELDVIADRVTVLRDGKYIATLDIAEASKEKLVSLMVGRELSSYYTKTNTASDEVILEVENLCDGKRVKSVSFDLRKGEILGFAGLVGAGRTETFQSIFGLSKKVSGKVTLDGKEIEFHSPIQAMEAGIGLVPEDRKKIGIFPAQSVRFNMTIGVLGQFLKNLRFDRKREIAMTQEYIDKMETKVSSMEQVISSLSGGNQQKVIIGRWLLAANRILILDEPTRGVDVVAKSEIYEIMNNLAAQGMAIVMISSELPELINMSDRVVVMSHGVSTGILQRDELDQEKIMMLATMEPDA
ncbi:MAG: sugar ABC transporter ATP-binding protein [Lachnospiraceae bacterium]|nr:sugar ABC transporter ATP-binding protein [Lachnospiraceae bacterium]